MWVIKIKTACGKTHSLWTWLQGLAEWRHCLKNKSCKTSIRMALKGFLRDMQTYLAQSKLQCEYVAPEQALLITCTGYGDSSTLWTCWKPNHAWTTPFPSYQHPAEPYHHSLICYLQRNRRQWCYCCKASPKWSYIPVNPSGVGFAHQRHLWWASAWLFG